MATNDTVAQVVCIVSAYVSHNSLPATDLPEVIGAVHASLLRLMSGGAVAGELPQDEPAVSVKRSVTRDYIVCLEDGKKFKSLRRHINSFHGLTPDEYRAKWNLPSDYPMVAPAYSATRSQLAKNSGLGQMGRTLDASGVEPSGAEEGEAKGAADAAKHAGESKGDGSGARVKVGRGRSKKEK